MLAGLIVAMRVITAPNSAFAHVRDNGGRWLVWSAGIYVLASLALVLLNPQYAFVTDSVPYVPEPNGGLQAAEHSQNQALDLGTISRFAATVLLMGCIPPALIYLLGRLFGGNKSWQKVFAVVFYTHTIYFPLIAIAMILFLVSDGSLSTIFGVVQIPEQSGDLEYGIPFLVWIILRYTVILVAIVWSIAVLAKAVRVVNGFGLGKSLGMIALAYLATFIVPLSFNV